MATLAEQRRAIGEQNEKARRAAGEAMAAARRALGDAMITRRTGRTEVEDLNAVVTPPRARRSLPALQPRGGVPAQVGTGNYTAPAATGGGLAWPLTEDDPTLREFYGSSRIVSSADGLVAIRLRNMKSITLRDDNDEEGQIIFGEPT